MTPGPAAWCFFSLAGIAVAASWNSRRMCLQSSACCPNSSTTPSGVSLARPTFSVILRDSAWWSGILLGPGCSYTTPAFSSTCGKAPRSLEECSQAMPPSAFRSSRALRAQAFGEPLGETLPRCRGGSGEFRALVRSFGQQFRDGSYRPDTFHRGKCSHNLPRVRLMLPKC